MLFSDTFCQETITTDRLNLSIGTATRGSYHFVQGEYFIKKSFSLFSRLSYSDVTPILRFPQSVVIDISGLPPEEVDRILLDIALMSDLSSFTHDRAKRFLFTLGIKGFYEVSDKHRIYGLLGVTTAELLDITSSNLPDSACEIGYRYGIGYRYDFSNKFFADLSLRALFNPDCFVWDESGIWDISFGYKF